MDEKQLTLVEEGLNLLIKKFALNNNEGDIERLKAVQEAKLAIRKVILSLAIKGEIKEIVPIVEKDKGHGWEVTDSDNTTTRYHA